MSRGTRCVAFQRNEEAKLLAQNEGPIASRLRSHFKAGDVKTSQTECTGGIDTNNQTVDKPSQPSTHQNDKSNNSVAKKSELNHTATSTIDQPSKDKCTTKSKDSKPESCKSHDSSSGITCQSLKHQNEHFSIAQGIQEDLKNQNAKNKASQSPLCKTQVSGKSSTSQNSKNQEPIKIQSSLPNMSKTSKPSSDVGKEKEKTRPLQKQAIKPRMEHPIHYIRWKGFEEPSIFLDCSLCEKDMTYLTDEEEWEHKSDVDELQYSIYWHEREEVGSILPEAAVLPCSHVFHSTCFSALQLSELIDPPCPICLSL